MLLYYKSRNIQYVCSIDIYVVVSLQKKKCIILEMGVLLVKSFASIVEH